jgi:regulator of sigma E protease
MDVLLSSVIADVWFDWVWPVLQFIIGLGLVVFVHELGHFLVARKVGIHVERFALGFGPRLLGIKRGGTDYCICAFPLGGYVKMLGQEDFAPLEEEAQPDPRSFAAKSVGQRFAVIAAGVVMNTIFAALLFLTVGMIGDQHRPQRRDAAAFERPARRRPIRPL